MKRQIGRIPELRAKWEGRNKGEPAHKRKIHNLRQRVDNLEDIIIHMSIPWYRKLWKRNK